YSKAIMVALIGVACSPISAGLAWYASHALQAPRFEVVDVTFGIGQENHKIDSSLVDHLQQNPSIVVTLKQGLTAAQAEERCFAWLSGGLWQDECSDKVRKVVSDMQDIIDAAAPDLESNIRVLEKWPGPPTQLELRPVGVQQLQLAFATAHQYPAAALTQF